MALTDVIVIGAGPAGIRAAIEAAAHGLQVLLIDEQPTAGGQIYRALGERVAPPPGALDVLGKDYWSGRELIDELRASQVEYVPGAAVWTVEKEPLAVGYVVGERAFLRTAQHVIVAAGAYERPVPIPGWTLPGVMTAGSAQVLMKSAGVIPAGRIALAGSGPLLMLVTSQLLAAGANVVAYLDTASAASWRSALPHLPRALGAPNILLKGLALQLQIARSRVPTYRGVTKLACLGAEKATGISFDSAGGTREIAADLVLLHEGVVPHVQISRLLGLEHQWYEAQRYWRPVVGKWGESSDARIHLVGDGAAIGGATVAAASGRIAALDVAMKLNAISAQERDRSAAALFAQRSKDLRVRPLLDHLYPPPQEICAPSDPTVVVCRCEEVDVAEIATCVGAGSNGPNQLKAFSRCGMGPCQGRMCGLTVAEIIARERDVPIEQVGYYRVRAPIKPMPLSALASLEIDQDSASS